MSKIALETETTQNWHSIWICPKWRWVDNKTGPWMIVPDQITVPVRIRTVVRDFGPYLCDFQTVNMLPISSVQEKLNWLLEEISMEMKSKQPYVNAIKKAADASGKMKWTKRPNAKNGFADIQMENLSKPLQTNTPSESFPTKTYHWMDNQSVLIWSGVDRLWFASLISYTVEDLNSFDIYGLNIKKYLRSFNSEFSKQSPCHQWKTLSLSAAHPPNSGPIIFLSSCICSKLSQNKNNQSKESSQLHVKITIFVSRLFGIIYIAFFQ